MTGNRHGGIGLTARVVGMAISGAGLVLFLLLRWYETARAGGWTSLWWVLALGGMGLVWSVIVRWQVVGPIVGLSLRKQQEWEPAAIARERLPGELMALDERMREILEAAHQHSESGRRSAEIMDSLLHSLASHWRALRRETGSHAAVLQAGIAELPALEENLRRVDEAVGKLLECTDCLGRDTQGLGNLLRERRAACRDLGGATSALGSRSQEFTATLDEVESQVQNLEGAVQSTAGSLTTVDELAKQVTGTASELERFTRNVHKIATDGESVLREVNVHARGTTQAVLESANTVKDLGSRSEEIGAVVEVIESIADETNLLALNAAIIAAQAGEHGKSFAVVAEEIRELAERTSSSTKEVADLVKGVQDGIDQAAQSIHESADRVHQSADLAERAGEFWERVLGGAKENVRLAESIVSSSSEQCRSTEKLGGLVEKLAGEIDAIGRRVQTEKRTEDRVAREIGSLQSLVERLDYTEPEIFERLGRLEKESAAAGRLLDDIRVKFSDGTGELKDARRRLAQAWNHLQQQMRLLELQRDALNLEAEEGHVPVDSQDASIVSRGSDR